MTQLINIIIFDSANKQNQYKELSRRMETNY